MTAAERLERAIEAIDQATAEVAAAAEASPAYAVESCRFLRAELMVTRRRLVNASRVLGGSPLPAA